MWKETYRLAVVQPQLDVCGFDVQRSFEDRSRSVILSLTCLPGGILPPSLKLRWEQSSFVSVAGPDFEESEHRRVRRRGKGEDVLQFASTGCDPRTPSSSFLDTR